MFTFGLLLDLLRCISCLCEILLYLGDVCVEAKPRVCEGKVENRTNPALDLRFVLNHHFFTFLLLVPDHTVYGRVLLGSDQSNTAYWRLQSVLFVKNMY